MKNPGSPLARRPGTRIDNQDHNTRSLAQPTAPPQIKSLPPAVERRLFGYVPFASGLPTSFLRGRR
jgi:hypothetical protein